MRRAAISAAENILPANSNSDFHSLFRGRARGKRAIRQNASFGGWNTALLNDLANQRFGYNIASVPVDMVK